MRNILTNEILENMISDYHNGLDLTELSKKYNFQEQTIQRHFHTLGLRITKGKAKSFSKSELENIIKDYQNGMKPFELAQKYKRESGTIIGKLKSINIYKNSTYRFTIDDVEFLKVHYPVGDWDAIHKRFPNIPKSYIHKKMSSLNIHIINHYWTKEDENILREKYPEMYGHIKELVNLFDNKYTYNAITSKARKMGLKTRDFWNEKELKILKMRYEYCTLDEVMTYLPNRSRSAIMVKALSLGLSNKLILETKFSESDKLFISNNYNHMTDKQIGEILGRSATSINNFRYRNGIVKLYEKSSYNDLSEYVRRNNLEWKKNSIINCNYKCILTDNRFDDIHHIYSLNLILNETLSKLGIKIKKSMDDYTDKELKNILKVFRINQSKYPLGVCLSKDIHALFHNMYGYGYNTQEQWDEFAYNFKCGKYNNILNVD